MKKLLVLTIMAVITHTHVNLNGYCSAYSAGSVTPGSVKLCFSPPNTPYTPPGISPDAECQQGEQCVNCDWAANGTPIGICQKST
jgi:hypothetical protein